MNSLAGKVCLVTGATRGIGEAIARRFAQEGARVVATGVASDSEPEWFSGAEQQDLLSYQRLDVADSKAVFAAIAAIVKAEGSLDVLVNNAGIEYSELIGMSRDEHVKEMLDVNAFGPFVATQHASRAMRRKGGGSIVNIASAVGIHGNAGQSAYAASKGAVIALTKSSAKELARFGIRVNAIAPGLTETRMLESADGKALEDRIARIPLGRVARADEVAAACAFLASDDASYITGQVLSVDGGAIL